MKKLLRKITKPYMRRYLRSLKVSDQEKELIKARRDFYKNFLKSGDLFIDVGANYGNRILPVINEGLKIVAVEPQEDCYKFLRMKFGNKIDIVTKGLGEIEEEKTMYISSTNTLSSFAEDWIDSIKESGRFEGQNWDEKRTMQMTTLDKLIEKHGVPAFIKIDVEGYELEVLKGLSKPFKYMSLEYTVPEQTDKLLKVLHRLADITGGKLEFNYSEGESMELSLKEWMNLEDMVAHVQSPVFLETLFGDIYVQTK